MFRSVVTAAVLSLAATFTHAASVTIDGTDAVYNLTDFGVGSTPGGSTAATSHSFTSGSGLVLSFSSVTGLTNCCNGTPAAGPDGNGQLAPTSITAANGISGINAPTTMFLVGVFIDSSSLPTVGTTPATLTYSSADYDTASFSPLLNQAFFIGDGQTGGGVTQSFNVAAGADTLLLGFADGGAFNGTPNFYGDNIGSLNATFDISSSTPAVPLPAGLPLLLAGMGVLGLMRRMRS